MLENVFNQCFLQVMLERAIVYNMFSIFVRKNYVSCLILDFILDNVIFFKAFAIHVREGYFSSGLCLQFMLEKDVFSDVFCNSW